MASHEELRTVGEQAALWRCSPSAIYAAINSGALPAVKIAERWLIDPKDAEKYLEQKRNVRNIPKRVRRPRRRAS